MSKMSSPPSKTCTTSHFPTLSANLSTTSDPTPATVHLHSRQHKRIAQSYSESGSSLSSSASSSFSSTFDSYDLSSTPTTSFQHTIDAQLQSSSTRFLCTVVEPTTSLAEYPASTETHHHREEPEVPGFWSDWSTSSSASNPAPKIMSTSTATATATATETDATFSLTEYPSPTKTGQHHAQTPDAPLSTPISTSALILTSASTSTSKPHKSLSNSILTSHSTLTTTLSPTSASASTTTITSPSPSPSPSTTQSSPTPTPLDATPNNTNTGIIVGATVGVFVILAIITGAVVFFWCRSRKRQSNPTPSSRTPPPSPPFAPTTSVPREYAASDPFDDSYRDSSIWPSSNSNSNCNSHSNSHSNPHSYSTSQCSSQTSTSTIPYSLVASRSAAAQLSRSGSVLSTHSSLRSLRERGELSISRPMDVQTSTGFSERDADMIRAGPGAEDPRVRDSRLFGDREGMVAAFGARSRMEEREGLREGSVRERVGVGSGSRNGSVRSMRSRQDDNKWGDGVSGAEDWGEESSVHRALRESRPVLKLNGESLRSGRSGQSDHGSVRAGRAGVGELEPEPVPVHYPESVYSPSPDGGVRFEHERGRGYESGVSAYSGDERGFEGVSKEYKGGEHGAGARKDDDDLEFEHVDLSSPSRESTLFHPGELDGYHHSDDPIADSRFMGLYGRHY
ncbi:hypothetical protein K491DRAFT_780584 [Lophiostoma macrostomum CBS 122681]|uniref:Uncharacterized protein n=1 Tax=Lophiostoma macrostomum CBS 122681 TaxID=1314788 RepID=A0A6A6T141_9PLEO|nr:hypothetical protein K491DRAFT_780584 [Lophiostoma macrostomum CBS 122681]